MLFRSNRTVRVDVRVVAATNAELEAEIAEGRFRADLYDRLRFAVIELPPLRERLEDVRPLCAYVADQLFDEVPSMERREFSEEALAAMESYAWPGNVRELKFAVERALCVAKGERVVTGDLPPELLEGGHSGEKTTGDFDAHIAAQEHGLLSRALAAAEGNQKSAAASLNLSYDRFRHLLRKYQLIGK